MLSVLLLLSLCTPAAADVLLVAPGGGGTHDGLQAAIDAAADGDIILVDPAVVFTGDPATATLDGKGLTIIGDGASPPEIPVLTVENVPAGSSVVLRNLRFASQPADPFTGGVLVIRDCAGTVLVEDCLMDGFDSELVSGGKGGPGLFIGGCAGVSIVRSTVTGGHGSSTTPGPPPVFSAGHGGRALRVIASSVSLHDCTIAGGDGGSDPQLFSHGGGGGLGLDTQNAQLWVVGCTVQGGEGGTGSPPGTSSFGAQIDGFGTASHLRELDTVFIGGTGMPGLSLVGGGHTELPGEAVTFSVSSPVRPGEAGTVRVLGPAGSPFGVFLGLGPGFLPVSGFNGVLVSALPGLIGPVLLAGIPASGSFEADFTVPAVGILDGFLLVDQVLSQQAGGELVLSNASAWVQIQNGL